MGVWDSEAGIATLECHAVDEFLAVLSLSNEDRGWLPGVHRAAHLTVGTGPGVGPHRTLAATAKGRSRRRMERDRPSEQRDVAPG
jgi:hypothetical protein